MSAGLSWSLGWTLVHALWIGAVVVGLAVAARRLATPQRRYRAGLGLLWLLLVSLPVTFVLLQATRRAPPEPVGRWLPSVSPPAGGVGVVDTTILPEHLSSDLPKSTSTTVRPQPLPAPADPVLHHTMPAETDPGNGSWIPAVREALPWLWLAGVLAGAGWLGLGCLSLRRLRRRAVVLRSGAAPRLAAELGRALGLRRDVTVATSDAVHSPAVVGVRRPVVLLPSGPLARWSDDELQLVLLHELAHVRRRDNLVNLLQRLAECLLCLQPAAWWLSRWVRHERELCCDAIVVERLGSRGLYAATLLDLTTPQRALPGLALAMSRAPLVDRIAHILRKESAPMPIPLRHSLPATTCALVACLMLDVRSQDPPPAALLPGADPAAAPAAALPVEPGATDPQSVAPGVLVADLLALLDPTTTVPEVSPVDVLAAVPLAAAPRPSLTARPPVVHDPRPVVPGMSDDGVAGRSSADCLACHQVHTAPEDGPDLAAVHSGLLPVVQDHPIAPEPKVLPGQQIVQGYPTAPEPTVVTGHPVVPGQQSPHGGAYAASSCRACHVGTPGELPPTWGEFVVRPGDSLLRISRLFFGNEDHVTAIVDANTALMRDPRLKVGQRLQIPTAPHGRAPQHPFSGLLPPAGPAPDAARAAELEWRLEQLREEARELLHELEALQPAPSAAKTAPVAGRRGR